MEAFCSNHFVNALTTLSGILIRAQNISNVSWSFPLPSCGPFLQHSHCCCSCPANPGRQRHMGVVGGLVVSPRTGGAGDAAGDASSGGPRGFSCSQQERGATGQPERRTRALAETRRTWGSMSSTFPLQFSLYLAHKRPQRLLLTSPCPHPPSSSPGTTSAC